MGNDILTALFELNTANSAEAAVRIKKMKLQIWRIDADVNGQCL